MAKLSRMQSVSLLSLVGSVATVAVAAGGGLAGDPPPPPGERPETALAPGTFDAAPFGRTLRDAAAGTVEVRWAEPRKVRRVVAELGGDAGPAAAPGLRLQYWHRIWDGRPDPVLAEEDAGSVGWAAMDDWTNGRWRDADVRVFAEGRSVAFAFEPTGAREFRDLGETGVSYRRALKIRVVARSRESMPVRVRALTDSVEQAVTVRIHLGEPAVAAFAGAAGASGPETCRLEVFNGSALSVRPVGGSGVQVGPDGTWTMPPSGVGTVEAEILRAVDPVDPRYDRTVVTVRSSRRPFSFAADEVARGDRVLVDDLGALVTRGDDPTSLEAWRRALRELGRKTVHRRVLEEPEQTLGRAWDDMPLKRPLWFVHGLPGNRNAMRQDADGSVSVTASRHWFERPRSPRDSDRKLWEGDLLRIGFGLPGGDLRGGRALEAGWLPLLRTWWQDGPVHYEEETILDALDGELDEIRGDDPTVLLARIRVVNTSADRKALARLAFTSSGAGPEELTIDRGVARAPFRDAGRVRFLIDVGGRGEIVRDGRASRWSLELGPGEAHSVRIAIPSVTVTEAEAEGLRGRGIEEDADRILAFWRSVTDRGMRISTSEPWIDGFHRAHLRHLLVNCVEEVGSTRRHAHVGTFSYGAFPDESAMMVSDLDRRGYHAEAERCLESFLHYQGTAPLPGNFASREGLFYGSGGHEMGGYNKSHGWVMWLMAEHWRLTRDREWMERAAPKLVAACDWVVRERSATKAPGPDGTRPIEYGFLPAGSLEDVTDYWYWVVTNACTAWGFQALATALEDFGHPEAGRLATEARSYRDDFLVAVSEARIRAPVVRLRDGTYVPKFPSRLLERGRCHGWLRETLEGSIHLPIMDLVDPESPEARWILCDFEDNLYISDAYGYAIPAFDRFWFSRGGFSMQANLLGGPLPYLYRDEIRHFLRAYFNSFASAFYPEIRMMNEHSLPELGYPAGDHFKSSDEAQSTYWLRLMLVHERNGDLYLGQAVPRAWLRDSLSVGIERAATYHGPVSLRIESRASEGRIIATLDPPRRNPPRRIFLRFRHPDGKALREVTVNGAAWPEIDPAREWAILPGSLDRVQEVVARY